MSENDVKRMVELIEEALDEIARCRVRIHEMELRIRRVIDKIEPILNELRGSDER